jgi:hypothetical protein
MKSVQEAIENDSVLKQWDSMDIVKKTSAVYFGEVSPEMIWKYYKTGLTMKPALYDQLLADYSSKENYTIPVMVFAYNKEALKRDVEPVYNGENVLAIASVKKNFDVE